MEYIDKYWAGFFPLLLIQVSSGSRLESVSKENTDLILKQFSSIHHLILHGYEGHSDLVLECIIRYQVHLLMCGTREQEKV